MRLLRPIALLSILTVTVTLAQNGGTIEPNPDGVLLRRVWMKTGQQIQQFVGSGAGAVGDINGDGINEFAVRSSPGSMWNIYPGSDTVPLSNEPIWSYSLPFADPNYPIVGDFYGTETNIVCFSQFHYQENPNRYSLYFFRPEAGSLADTPFAVLNPWETVTPQVIRSASEVLAHDLDNDGDDELIIAFHASVSFDQPRSTVGEIWIYEGGEGFQVETPTLIIRDTEENNDNGFTPVIGDFDGDGFTDLALSSRYRSQPKVKFWWGSSTSPWGWSQPESVLELGAGIGVNTGITPHDIDGDSIPDLAGTVYGDEPDAGAYLYLSRSGKDFRLRSFALSDAELFFRISNFHTLNFRFGYLNDSLQRFEMFGLAGLAPSQQGSIVYLFSGGKNGPNKTYDAYYATELDGLPPGNVFQHGGPVGDVNGDGWNDIVASYPRWGNGLDYGIAMVLAGGPYIPTDDRTTDVREVPVSGERGGLFLWPNPVRDMLNIAWRGNLRAMPVRFAVFDMAGREVTAGDVTPGLGAARWTCAGVAAGTYLLVAYDRNGATIATAHVIKQE